jgi:hypothetical protein
VAALPEAIAEQNMTSANEHFMLSPANVEVESLTNEARKALSRLIWPQHFALRSLLPYPTLIFIEAICDAGTRSELAA